MFAKRIIIGLVALFLLVSCSDPNLPKIDSKTEIIKSQITDLKSSLDERTLVNAAILESYIVKTKASNPEYESILTALSRQYTSKNSGVAKLEERLAAAHKDLGSGVLTSGEALAELENLKLASDKDTFNDSLVDEINTVAALSNGALKPLNQPEGKELKAGANLVGNPTYGRWRQGGGSSFWVWYGQYSMFRSVFGRPRYSSWYYNRPWSYGYDVYNNNYGSRRWKQSENQTLNQNYNKVREYGRTTNRKPSNYANRANSKVMARPSGRGNSLSSTRRRTASYGPSASKKASPYSSSSRSGTRSRSSRGGK